MTDEKDNLLQRGLENIQPPFSSFIRAQTTSSLFLLIATLVALWWANSDYSSAYQNLTHLPVGIFLGNFELQASLKHVNAVSVAIGMPHPTLTPASQVVRRLLHC